MKQIFLSPKSGKIRVEEITPPRVKSGGVLVKNYFSVISIGTERGIIELSKKSLLEKAKERPDYVRKFFMLMKTKGLRWAWGVAQSKLSKDIALGYSSSGEVIEAGREVEEFRAGDRVACAGQDYASHAEYVFVPKNLCVKIPRNVSEKEAAFSTLAAIAMQGVRRANLTPGESVAVVGLGSLGQLATRMLKAYGHPVIGFDVNRAQVDFAKRYSGLDTGVVIDTRDIKTQVHKFTDGRGVDAVLIYASTKSDEPLKLAVQISRDRGRVVQIGNITAHIPWRDFYSKELTYYSSRSYGPGRYDESYEEGGVDYPLGHVRWTERRNMEEFLRLLSEKKISVEDLVSHTFDIADAEKAYQLVSKPKGPALSGSSRAKSRGVEGLIHGIVLSYPGTAAPETLIHLESREEKKRYAPQTQVRVGLIGLGSFMKSEILPHLKKCGGVKVAAIAHSGGLDAKYTGRTWGAEYVTSDYRKLLEDKNIDLIICATRHSSHAKIAKEVLSANKNLHMEKPLALNEEELKEVMEVARKSKGRLFVGFNRRFSKHLIAARREFADSMPIMVLYRVNAPLEEHWSHDPKEGGRLIGEGCHFVDALQFLTGSRPKRVCAGAVPVGGAVRHEENFSFTVEYENGSLGTVVYSGLGNFRLPKEYIEIYGDGKIMVIDNFKNARVMYPNKTNSLNVWHQHKGYLEELQALIDAIREGKPSPISLDELFISHLTTFKVAEALKTGKVVEF